MTPAVVSVGRRAAPSGTLWHGFGSQPAAPLLPRLLRAGERLRGPNLEVIRLLGQGGMGEVYEVEHPELGRRFAVKVLHRTLGDRPDLAARLWEEARSMAQIRHRNVVEVFDLAITGDGRPYFAMELLAGRDLRAELARRGVFEVAEALALLDQALAGLAAVHAAGIVHRDVKLENLFLGEDGVLKVLDFGVAKLEGSRGWRTVAGALIGTPRTMAPEQCAAAEVDERADLYAAGLAIYELVAGRGPFDEFRGQPDALRFAHCDRPPPPPSRLSPQPIPPAVERLILRALEKLPAHRFQSAEEMRSEVRHLRAELGGATVRSSNGEVPASRTAPTVPDAPPTSATWEDPPPRTVPRLHRARRPRGVPRRAARPSASPRLAPAAGTLAAVLGACALGLASVALGLTLASRLPPPSAAEPSVDAGTKAAVR